MNPRTNAAYDGHEEIVFVGEEALGYKGVIAIHSTALGPAAGGCRIWSYADDEAALTDVLRLSRGMSYKNAMAELPLGGGKAVLYKMGPDRAACLEAFGRDVENLHGRYITAEDVGATVNDMKTIARATSFVTGIPKEEGRAGGDPSPWTARGVYLSIQAMLAGSVRGRTIAVQGVGAVGRHLCQLLAQDGAKLVISDVNKTNLARIEPLGAEVAPVDEIHAVTADLFAPCALGAGLNQKTIPELGAKIICGAANNQLATDDDGARLVAAGITYAPDYVVNAGGIIMVSCEYLGEREQAVDAKVAAIAPRVLGIVEEGRREGVSPHLVSDRLVRAKIDAARK